MDDLIIKMIMNYGKHTDKYWADSDDKMNNVRLKGDTVFFQLHSNHYITYEEIELLELLAWVHSNVA